MWRNYFKTAFRNLWKHKGFTLLNTIGLSIGIACSILIFLFVIYEFSYDKYNEKADRIYRIAFDALIGSTEIHQTGTAAPMAETLCREYPEIECATRINDYEQARIEIENKSFIEDYIVFGRK